MPDEIITMDDMAAIFSVTDEMGIHRESVRVELTKEDPGSITQAVGGIVEITIPESRTALDFATEVRAALEAMGFVLTEDTDEGEDEI
jgi:hypothetical protein